MRLKELPEELRDLMVALRHRSVQGYEISTALKVLKSTMTSIILKEKKFRIAKTLPGLASVTSICVCRWFDTKNPANTAAAVQMFLFWQFEFK
uniref:Uncharacterized protein n=1 Tax=Oryzias latipes TaxID=8090 RepID=A0A3P9LDD0_ORYLA